MDLSKRKQKYFDLVMIDGTKLQIKKPNEQLIYDMEEFEKSLRNAAGVKKIYDALLFMEQDVDGEYLYDYDVCMSIFREYSKFTQEVLSNPN